MGNLVTLDVSGVGSGNNDLRDLILPDDMNHLNDLILPGNELRSLKLPSGMPSLKILDLSSGNQLRSVEVPFDFDLENLELKGWRKNRVSFYIPLTIKPIEDRIEVSWTQGVLQSTDRVGGLWNPVEGAVSPHQFDRGESMRFFRAIQE